MFDWGHSFVPTCASDLPSRAAAVKDGRSFSGHRRLVLDGGEHGGMLVEVGTCSAVFSSLGKKPAAMADECLARRRLSLQRSHVCSPRRRCASGLILLAAGENRPGDARQLVGQRNDQHVAVQAL